jgi:release factor glutamine methyltransferase
MNQIHTIGSLRTLMKQQLEGYYENRELDSLVDLLLEEYLGQSRLSLRLNADQPVPEEVLTLLKSAINRLKEHVPVQYVLGKAPFCGLEFIVNEHVLIPRQETEELVEWIIADQMNRLSTEPLRILDIGTGSGCIAISLKRRIPGALVTALDISREALVVAGSNAGLLDADILFLQNDILNPTHWNALGCFDLIVSNPPYVLPSDRIRMKTNVLAHEPAIALFVDEDHPLIFYDAIASFSQQHLLPKGSVYLEINEKMGLSVCDLFNNAGFDHSILRKDINGRDRMVQIKGSGKNRR